MCWEFDKQKLVYYKCEAVDMKKEEKVRKEKEKGLKNKGTKKIDIKKGVIHLSSAYITLMYINLGLCLEGGISFTLD